VTNRYVSIYENVLNSENLRSRDIHDMGNNQNTILVVIGSQHRTDQADTLVRSFGTLRQGRETSSACLIDPLLGTVPITTGGTDP
jgi:hypothetical protein